LKEQGTADGSQYDESESEGMLMARREWTG